LKKKQQKNFDYTSAVPFATVSPSGTVEVSKSFWVLCVPMTAHCAV
jgi:hypothetical protein